MRQRRISAPRNRHDHDDFAHLAPDHQLDGELSAKPNLGITRVVHNFDIMQTISCPLGSTPAMKDLSTNPAAFVDRSKKGKRLENAQMPR